MDTRTHEMHRPEGGFSTVLDSLVKFSLVRMFAYWTVMLGVEVGLHTALAFSLICSSCGCLIRWSESLDKSLDKSQEHLENEKHRLRAVLLIQARAWHVLGSHARLGGRAARREGSKIKPRAERKTVKHIIYHIVY